ncbi:MAG: ABC transporter substrate-binding protein [Thermoleophilia bacterium]|nr:ABC transporter substrate-binding protein [Thermoleophilia bacterium]
MRRKTAKAAWLVGIILLVGLLTVLVAACGEEETTTTTAAPATTATTSGGTTETTAAESTTTSAAGPQPVYGGVLRLIHNSPAQVLGYWPEQGPVDEAAVFPGVERIMRFAPGRTLVPDLAKEVTEDPDGLTITVKLNEGILFHDGTELTAEVAKWNYDLAAPTGKLQFADAIKEFEIVDKYTYVLHLNYWHNQLLQSLAWVPMYSKEAYEKNGGQEWARTHCVGTGPFILKEFNRDQNMIWEKNPNYWRKGQPYLDGVEVTYIMDSTTAAAMMEAGQADIWQSANAQERSEMLKKGFKVQSGWAGFQFHLMPNTKDPNSPFKDQRVREAVEYALDKPAICEAIGYGFYEPIYAVSPPGEWGSDRIVVKREYNPEKAKQLLAEAGYGNGLAIDLLAPIEAGGRNTGAEAVKGYLDAAGFITNIDIADPGRFYGSVFGTGWKDLALMFSGNDVTYLMSACAWWGPQPKTNLASFERPEEFKALFDKALMARDLKEQEKLTGDIVAYMNEHALMIPLFHYPAAIVCQNYVHTEYPMEGGFVRWSWNETWMEAH